MHPYCASTTRPFTSRTAYSHKNSFSLLESDNSKTVRIKLVLTLNGDMVIVPFGQYHLTFLDILIRSSMKAAMTGNSITITVAMMIRLGIFLTSFPSEIVTYYCAEQGDNSPIMSLTDKQDTTSNSNTSNNILTFHLHLFHSLLFDHHLNHHIVSSSINCLRI